MEPPSLASTMDTEVSQLSFCPNKLNGIRLVHFFSWLNQDTTQTDTIPRFSYPAFLLFLSSISRWLGPNVAQYSGEGLHKRIVADKAFAKGDYKTAIKNGFLEMDRALRFGTKGNIGDGYRWSPSVLLLVDSLLT